MKDMPLDDWIAEYERKTGEEFKPTPGFKLFFFPNRGFAEIRVTEKMIIVRQMCGEAKFWKDLVGFFAQALGIYHVGTYCIRNIYAYIRLFGFHVVSTEDLNDGYKRLFCVDKYGNKGQASPAWKSTRTGVDAYYITWEVTQI